MITTKSVPITRITLEELSPFQIHLYIKRLDLIHPAVSGNKYFKLTYNLQEAKRLGYERILTFGGAFSNHIYATAAAAKDFGLQSIGVIRGEPTFPLNPTLTFAQKKGMELTYLNRQQYRQKNSSEILDKLKAKFPPFYLIPEGGTNALAIKGAGEILSPSDRDMDYIALGVGTGGTISGILSKAHENQKVLGFPALKGDFITDEVKQLLDQQNIHPACDWEIIEGYHFGGYGKFKPELIDFIKKFKYETGIPLDPIYTGKLMFGVLEEIKKGTFKKGSKIMVIHSGGLQGIAGFNQRFGESLESE